MQRRQKSPHRVHIHPAISMNNIVRTAHVQEQCWPTGVFDEVVLQIDGIGVPHIFA